MANMQQNSLATVAACALLLAQLVACGGGGSESSGVPTVSKTPTFEVTKATLPGVFLINPAATWKPIASTGADGNRGPVTTIDLAALMPPGVPLAGASFNVQVLGAYDATSMGNARTLMADVSAVFVNSQGVVVAQSGSSPLPSATSPSCDSIVANGDPFPNDFRLSSGTTTKLVVPAGAVQLRVSVDDCFFVDNVSLTSDLLRLDIRHAGS